MENYRYGDFAIGARSADYLGNTDGDEIPDWSNPGLYANSGVAYGDVARAFCDKVWGKQYWVFRAGDSINSAFDCNNATNDSATFGIKNW